MTWVEINQNWAHIQDVLRAKLPVNDDIVLTRQLQFVPAPRPMLEDIICLRAAKDDFLIAYLRAAGIDITLKDERPPKIIDLNARNTLFIGQGGQSDIGHS